MARILGTELAQKLGLGYLVSNYNRIGRFTPEETAVPFGKLLKYGTSIGHYEAVEGTETDATVIAGVSVHNQAKAGTVYPGGISTIPFGEYGDALLVGDIVVELSTHVGDEADVVEGAKVYLATDGKVSPDASHVIAGPTTVNHLLLPQFIFLGQVDVAEDGTTLVAVRKLY
jgi:hypothetical protein